MAGGWARRQLGSGGTGPAAIAAGPALADAVMKTIIVSRAKRLESFINLSLLSQTNGTGTGFESMNQQSVACREAAAAARADVVRADARTCPTGAVAVRRGRRGSW